MSNTGETNPVLQRRQLLGGALLALASCDAPEQTAEGRPRSPAQPIDHGAEILRVGPGREYKSLTLAGARLQAKWTNDGHPVADPAPAHVIISPAEPGYYVNDSGSHSRRWPSLVGWPPYEGNLLGPVVIEGEPGKPPPDLVTDGYGDGVLYYQAGLFTTTGYDTVFRNLHFSGFRRRDGGGNYAAIRLNPQDGRQARLLVEDVEIDHCDDGILGGDPGLTVTLRRCYFHDCGNTSGLSHNVYIGRCASFIAEDVLSTHCTIGHLMKSRSARTTLRRTRLLGAGGSESACLDVPDGGVLEIDGLVCEKSTDSDASWIIHYAGENQDAANMPFYTDSAVRINNLTMIAPRRLTRHPDSPIDGFSNHSGDGEAASGAGSHLVVPAATNISVFGLTARSAGLPGARILPSRPELDMRSPVVRGGR